MDSIMQKVCKIIMYKAWEDAHEWLRSDTFRSGVMFRPVRIPDEERREYEFYRNIMADFFYEQKVRSILSVTAGHVLPCPTLSLSRPHEDGITNGAEARLAPCGMCYSTENGYLVNHNLDDSRHGGVFAPFTTHPIVSRCSCPQLLVETGEKTCQLFVHGDDIGRDGEPIISSDELIMPDEAYHYTMGLLWVLIHSDLVAISQYRRSRIVKFANALRFLNSEFGEHLHAKSNVQELRSRLGAIYG
jgi:hypothetical protein